MSNSKCTLKVRFKNELGNNISIRAQAKEKGDSGVQMVTYHISGPTSETGKKPEMTEEEEEESYIDKLPIEILMEIFKRNRIGIFNIPAINLTCRSFYKAISMRGGKNYWFKHFKKIETLSGVLDITEYDIKNIMKNHLHTIDGGFPLNFKYFEDMNITKRELMGSPDGNIALELYGYCYFRPDFPLANYCRIPGIDIAFKHNQDKLISSLFITDNFYSGASTETKKAYIFYASKYGRIEMGKEFQKRGARFGQEACRISAKHGQFEMLKWLHSIGAPLCYETLFFSVKNGHFEMLKWLCENGGPLDERTCSNAAIHGRFEMLKWLRRKGAPFDALSCAYAAKKGHFEILKWLRENGAPWNTYTCAFAAENGQFEILKWLRENGAPFDKWTCVSAAKNGQFEILKWLCENRAPCSTLTCLYAASNGRFEILKWLHENGIPLDEITCQYAAKSGKFEMLKWLREKGTPWNEHTCSWAAMNGHFEILKWCIENGAPFDTPKINYFIKKSNDTEMKDYWKNWKK